MKVNIKVTGIEEIEALLEKIAKRGQDFQPALDKAGTFVENIITLSFEDERSPDGEEWSPLADSTLVKKEKAGNSKKLYDEGTLFESIAHEADSNSLTVGVYADSKGYLYPVVHQFGSKDGKIPARPFMPIDNDGELYGDVKEELIDLLKDFLAGD